MRGSVRMSCALHDSTIAPLHHQSHYIRQHEGAPSHAAYRSPFDAPTMRVRVFRCSSHALDSLLLTRAGRWLQAREPVCKVPGGGILMGARRIY